MDELSFKKNLELNTLIEFSNLINSNLDFKFILGNILLTIMGRMLITRGMILIKSNEGENLNEFTVESSKGVLPGTNGSVVYFEPLSDSVFTSEEFKNQPEIFISNKIEYFFKIFFSNKLLGLLCLGAKPGGQQLNKNDIIFIETILNISSTTIENTIKFNEIKKLNYQLNGKIGNLKSLFELSKEFNTNFLDRNKIVRLLNYTMLGNYGVKDFLIISKYNSDKYYIMSKTSNIESPDFSDMNFSFLNDPVVLSDSGIISELNEFKELGYELVIPIHSSKHKAETIAFLGKKLNKQSYTQEDIEFIESVLNISVISIENSILFKESIEKKILENELNIAREIQLALLPKNIPQTEEYKIHAVNSPARQVGGDYFDIVKLNEDSLALAIADVSGKGTPAALLMSNLQSAVRSYLKIYDDKFNLSEITLRINNLIFECTTPEKFITFFWGILNTRDNKFFYINAGHNPGYLINNNIIKELNEGGLIIGITDTDIKYDTGCVELDKNDLIVLFTDGITEARNSDGEEFGTGRLLNCIKNNIKEKPANIVNCILNDVKSFSEGIEQYDDQTIIIIKRFI
ncbi:MAG: PP2C family protein-serine/threonine phosphatase [Ignavibacteria bacterium]|nr:PP2C family protein-serine/threonine phosphatase [Ignavibacteria bacterium]